MALRKGDYDYSWVDGASQAISLFSIVAWLLSSVGAGISFAAVGTISFVAAGFPMYLMLVGLALGLNIYLRQKVVPVKEAN
jgi:hypothetical protein